VNQNLENFLSLALSRLEAALSEVLKNSVKKSTQKQSVENIHILKELVKEQMQNENINSAARKTG
jgi:hypothetical protein